MSMMNTVVSTTPMSGEIDTMRTVDFMPTNSRDILRWNSYMVMMVSGTLNCLLISVLLTEKNTILRAYSNVLMLNCICDLFYTLVTFLTDLHLDLNDGMFIIVLGGIYKYYPVAYSYVGVFFYLFSLYISIMVIPIVFYFRYQLVVKNTQMTRWELMRISTFPIGLSFIPSIALSTGLFFDERKKTCRKLLGDQPIWQLGGPIDKCIMCESSNPLLHLYLISMTLINSMMYGLMIFFTVAIFRAIKCSKATVNTKVNTKTASLQRQMNVLLLVQLILPMICACLPFTAVVVLTLLRLRVRGLGILILLNVEWVPLANPLITILLVTNYRRRTARLLMSPLVALCKRILPNHGIRSTTATTSNLSQDGNSTHHDSKFVVA